MNYWYWLFRGSGGKPGYQRFLDRWLVVHCFVGLGMAWIVPIDTQEAAKSVLLPLGGLFIGLCFALGGNANALLQTEEIEEMASHHAGGLSEYAHVYQSAILVILLSLTLWGIGGLGIIDKVWPTPCNAKLLFGAKATLYASASLTLRECWHVVLGAQQMLMAKHQIRQQGRKEKLL